MAAAPTIPEIRKTAEQKMAKSVDAFKADGRAFVTEYAGPGPKGGNLSVYDPAWNQAAFVGLDPAQVKALAA